MHAEGVVLKPDHQCQLVPNELQVPLPDRILPEPHLEDNLIVRMWDSDLFKANNALLQD